MSWQICFTFKFPEFECKNRNLKVNHTSLMAFTRINPTTLPPRFGTSLSDGMNNFLEHSVLTGQIDDPRQLFFTFKFTEFECKNRNLKVKHIKINYKPFWSMKERSHIQAWNARREQLQPQSPSVPLDREFSQNQNWSIFLPSNSNLMSFLQLHKTFTKIASKRFQTIGKKLWRWLHES